MAVCDVTYECSRHKCSSEQFIESSSRDDVIYLDIGAICWHKIFVNVGSGFPDARLGRINAAPASDFPEKSLTSATFKKKKSSLITSKGWFDQYSASSFYTRRSQKCKRHWWLDCLLSLLRSAQVKRKSTPGVNFIKVLRAAFMCADLKSAERLTAWLYFLRFFWDLRT